MADITDITTGTKNGTGYFDKFMDSINVHIEDQFVQGRITGKDYATVYLGALQAALQQAVAYVGIQEQVSASALRTAAEAALLGQKLLTERAQVEDTLEGSPVLGAVGKQKELQQAQIKGFSRDAEQKALKILMDSWNVNKSVLGDSLEVPDGARNDDIEDLIIKLRQGVEVTGSIYKFSADAGPNQEVGKSSFVMLDGTGSTAPFDDPDNPEDISTTGGYSWSIVLGSNTTGAADPLLDDDTSATPNFTAPAAAGEITFQLEITGTENSRSFDTVTITIV